MRDLVARGKPQAHPRKQREAVPGLVVCRWSCFHHVLCMRDLVARGKPQAHPREQRGAVPGFGYAAWLFKSGHAPCLEASRMTISVIVPSSA